MAALSLAWRSLERSAHVHAQSCAEHPRDYTTRFRRGEKRLVENSLNKGAGCVRDGAFSGRPTT